MDKELQQAYNSYNETSVMGNIIDSLAQENSKLKAASKMDTMEFLEKTDVETMFPVVLLKKLEEENAKLREALEWYGDEKRYYWEPIFGPGEIDFDKGEKARKALGRPE